ncbi:hypothetical protein ACLOJK_012859 [Asimina triloba]
MEQTSNASQYAEAIAKGVFYFSVSKTPELYPRPISLLRFSSTGSSQENAFRHEAWESKVACWR